MIILSGAGEVESAGPVATPILWLKADSLSLSDGDAVGTWADSSGNGNDVTQATGANKPTFKADMLGGLPSVFFDGGDFLSLASALGTAAVTVFAVCRNVDQVNDARAILGGAGGAATDLRYTLDRNITGFFGGGGVNSSTVVRQSFWTQSNFTKAAAATASTVNHRINQADQGTGAGNNSVSGFDTIGAFSTGATGFTGHVSELIVYDRVLSGGEILDVEAYLEDRYAILDSRVLWLKGDQITGKSDGDSVTSWTDVSGKGNHFLSSGFTAPLYKTNLQNSLPGLRFGTGTGMRSNLHLHATPYTIYIVYNYRSSSSAARRALQGGNNWLIGPYSNIHRCFSGGFSTGLNVVQDQFVIQWVVGSSTNNTNNVNGTGYTSGGSDKPGRIGLSVAGAFGELIDGDILEVMIEDRADDSTQQAAVKNYLATKYSITVS